MRAVQEKTQKRQILKMLLQEINFCEEQKIIKEEEEEKRARE
jgi:DNA gyrase/topoisomerase IV subunit A